MTRPLIAAAALLAAAALFASAASAQTSSSAKPAARASAKKAPPKDAEPAPTSTPDDNLTPGQLTMADRVLTGVAACEFNQTVRIEPLEGHSGNFKLTFERKTYIVEPKETTTGAILLVDRADTIEWVQIPKKSMLMNQKEHHRMVDNCQQDEQRIATESAATAGANAPVLAPSVATAASVAAAGQGAVAKAATVAPGASAVPAPRAASAPRITAAPAAKATATKSPTTKSTATTKVEPPPPVQRGAQAPDAAASGMWK
jgi:hypothetical protein